MKLLNPTKGQIFFDNENITNYNNRQMIVIRKKLQMILKKKFCYRTNSLNWGLLYQREM